MDSPLVSARRVPAPAATFSVQADCTLALSPATIAYAACRGWPQRKGSV